MRIDDSVVQVSLNEFADDLTVQHPILTLSQETIDTVLRKRRQYLKQSERMRFTKRLRASDGNYGFSYTWASDLDAM